MVEVAQYPLGSLQRPAGLEILFLLLHKTTADFLIVNGVLTEQTDFSFLNLHLEIEQFPSLARPLHPLSRFCSAL